MVRGTVVCIQSRAVNTEYNREMLQSNVMQNLIVRTLQKSRINGDSRTFSLGSQPCRKGDGVFLSNADIKKILRHAFPGTEPAPFPRTWLR